VDAKFGFTYSPTPIAEYMDKPQIQQSIGSIKQEKPSVRTRFGYDAKDCVKSLQEVLSQSGSAATGKALHFSADLICSGGFEIWIRLIWSYVFQHVHLASLRIFVYLQKRTAELEEYMNCLDFEELYKNPEFQHRISELVIVVQTLPRQNKITWPKVPNETHDAAWLHSVQKAKESDAVNRVWDARHDQPILRFVGNQILLACEEVNIEHALFWLKWLFDEDKRVRTVNNGLSSLTTNRRSGTAGAKVDKSEIGYFIVAVLAEAYKELARKGAIRMHEEFQELINLWRGKQARLSSKQKQECIAFMILVLTEVPRWKVPAAQPLIKDPTVMSRAVQQSVRFFQEIVVKPRVNSILPKDIVAKKAKKTVALTGTGTKADSTEDKMRLMDEMVMEFIRN
jgi:hypothetical protein